MLEIFTKVVSMSIAAGIAITAIIIIRCIFRKMTGKFSCALWIPIGLRLVMPFSLSDAASNLFAGIQYEDSLTLIRELSLISNVTPESSNPENITPLLLNNAEPSIAPAIIAAYVWLIGTAIIIHFIILSYIHLSLRLRTATRWNDNVYQSDRITYPFVFGIIHPRIYLPYSANHEDVPFILEHEREHIKRGDHIAKSAALLILAIHWFNPLVWAAFALLCRDIEKACDESVISLKNHSERQQYSYALLSCSTGKRLNIYTVAFGKSGLKERIVHIMNYSKPTFVTNMFFSALCAIAVLGVLILPVGCDNTAVSENADDSFVYGENMAREINADGSVIMRYNAESNISTDGTQIFLFDGNGDTLTVEVDGGTVCARDENGRVNYWVEPSTITVDFGKAVYWIPQELYDFDNLDERGEPINRFEAKNAVITFTMYKNNIKTDTAVVTITANRSEREIWYKQLTYTISVDNEHILILNEENKAITIMPAE